MSSRRSSVAALIAVGVLLATGCGSDDSSSDGTTPVASATAAATETASATDATVTESTPAATDTAVAETTGTPSTDTAERDAADPATTTAETAADATAAGEEPAGTTEPDTATTDAPAAVGWVTHRGDPDDPSCQCADGSEHVFHSLDRDPTKVLLYFQGGGACFSAETCDFETGTYKVTAGEDDLPEGGIFEWDHEDNPFSDWSVVFVPYCSGDVFLGDAEHEYAPDLVVQHRGALHAQKGLDHVVATYPDAEQLFVTGSSAGAVPTPRIGGLAADALPDTDITVLADASGGYASREGLNSIIGALWGFERTFPDWPELTGAAPGSVGIPDLFTITGLHAPRVELARFDNAHDRVQQGFSSLAGADTTVLDVLDENEARIEAAGVELDVYVAPGNQHTILGRDELWDVEVEGVAFLDWLTTLVDTGAPGDVRCTECGQPEG